MRFCGSCATHLIWRQRAFEPVAALGARQQIVDGDAAAQVDQREPGCCLDQLPARGRDAEQAVRCFARVHLDQEDGRDANEERGEEDDGQDEATARHIAQPASRR